MTRRVIYTAQGHRNISEKDILGVHVNRDTPIQPGNSSSWKPFPLSIPNIELSITTCSIIELRYILKVQAVISGAINPHVEFNLLLGNVPVSGNEGSQSFPPSAPPATAPYPASIPTQGTPYIILTLQHLIHSLYYLLHSQLLLFLLLQLLIYHKNIIRITTRMSSVVACVDKQNA